MKYLAIASLLVAALLSSAASADTITFGSAPVGSIAGPVIEGDFRYALFGGALFIDAFNGNPGHEAEGSIPDGGGTLRILREDVVGGLFFFDGAHVVQWNLGAVPILFEGYLGGALQASDALVTSATSLTHLALASANLNGVAIDELRVVLDAAASPLGWEGVDNLEFTVVPEPGTAALLVAGLLALQWSRRRA